jgi:Ca-activated chloride channel family protein
MRFANPEFLLLAPLAVAVAWWWARRPRPALRFSDTSLFAGPRGGRAWRAVWGGTVLRGLACLALVLACAGPRTPDERTRLPADALAIMMIIDVSGSMDTKVSWAAGQEPVTRLEAARRALKLFLVGGETPDGAKFEGRPSDQVGLVKLAAVPYTVCPLTLNHSVLLTVADELKPEDASLLAGTNVGDALAEAIIRLDATHGLKTKLVILLSDGQHIQSKEGKDAMLRPREAAQLAANLGYKVFTIDAGGDPAALPDPAERAEREEGRRTLQDIAAMTGGRAFEATDGNGMLAAYHEIDSLERVKIETYQYRRYFEYYWWCALAALVFLLSAHVLERTRWRTVP